MWTLYTLIVAVVSALFISNEYYLSRFNEPFLRKETYVAVLVWSAVLVFFQNYFGIFNIFLLALYSLLLKHVSMGDMLAHVRKYWYLIVIFGLTQISFMYRALFVNGYVAFSDLSIKTAQNHIDWISRLYKPIVYALYSQPLILFYALGVLLVAFFYFYKKSFFLDRRRRKYVVIACVHPILVYLFFHVLIGFNIAPRYAIIMTVALSFSAVILASQIGKVAAYVMLALSIALFIIVNVHAIKLYWRASSETALLKTIAENYNSSDNIFIGEPSSLRLTLPVNDRSLLFLDKKRQDMERFKFLLKHQDLVRETVAFKPLTLITYSEEEKNEALLRFKVGTSSVWTISVNGDRLCTTRETQAGTCFGIHTKACGVSSHEINTLPVFLSSTRLGNCYIVRKAY